MDKSHENKKTMYEAVATILNENSDKTTTVPAFADSITEFSNVMSEIEKKSAEVSDITTGKALAKSAAATTLIDGLVPMCAALFSMARKNNDTELKAKTDLSEYSFRRLRDTDLKAKAQEIIGLANANIANLAPFSVTQDKLTQLQTALDAYSNALGDRAGSVSQRIGANATLWDLFTQADEILQEEIDKHMEHLRADYPEFYEAYFNARRIRHEGIRHKAVQQKAAAAPAPVPVK